MRTRYLLLLLLLMMVVTACAKDVPPPAPAVEAAAPTGPLATVLLLADLDGHVGRVVVTDNRGKTAVLEKEQYVVHVGRDRQLTKPEFMDKQAIESQFGKVLRAFPDAPVTFILYFRGKTNVLTEESKRMLSDIGKAFRSRKSTDISIVGHTDLGGSKKHNLLISEKRAQLVSKLLFKQQRIPWMAMEVISHGEAFPLVATEDSKTMRVNQRVEVTIR